MSWVEQSHKERKKLTVTTEREALLDEVKAGSLPIIRQEANAGDRPIKPVHFQEVRSPGIFEGEFGVKDGDLIFHFWPWGLHQADRDGKPRPPFPTGFGPVLRAVLTHHFGLTEISEQRDLGSWYAKAAGVGRKQFWFDLAVKAVTDLHHQLGGK